MNGGMKSKVMSLDHSTQSICRLECDSTIISLIRILSNHDCTVGKKTNSEVFFTHIFLKT